MRRRYATVDVFTAHAFSGNPLAVVLDATGLDSTRMQQIASEFNYSETTFVLAPRELKHTAQIRIFTPRTEVPFAGHPNVGTAFVLASREPWMHASASGMFIFEEAAGLVPVRLLREQGRVAGAELTAPEQLSRRSQVSPDKVASCLNLSPADICCSLHPPQVVSVGLPFLVAELASRNALSRAKPNVAEFAALLPLDGADAIFAYTRDRLPAEQDTDIQARMFSPLDNIVEDPATGSAAAAAAALIAQLEERAHFSLRVGQGVDMGRSSALFARIEPSSDGASRVYVGGRCAAVMEGGFDIE